MREMRKLLLLVVLLGAVGALGYLGYQRFLAPASQRACQRVADRCGLGDDEVAACRKVIADVRESSGAEAASKLTSCLADATSCSQAAGCAAGTGLGLLSRSMLDFLDGLRRAH